MKFYKSYRANTDHNWHNNISEGYDEAFVYRNTEQYYHDHGDDNVFEIVAFDENDEEVGCETVEFDPVQQSNKRESII